MKHFTIVLIALLFSFSLLADTYVKGYYRKSGTYVKPHYRSSANGTKSDNWSTYGNTNPYTGKTRTKKYNNNSYGTKSIYGSGSKKKSAWGY